MADKPIPDVPSTHKGPRYDDVEEQTGTGTPRSADDGLAEPGAMGDRTAPVDPAVITGAETDSHPSAADEVDINRSGSGGTGGESIEDEDEPSPS